MAKLKDMKIGQTKVVNDTPISTCRNIMDVLRESGYKISLKEVKEVIDSLDDKQFNKLMKAMDRGDGDYLADVFLY